MREQIVIKEGIKKLKDTENEIKVLICLLLLGLLGYLVNSIDSGLDALFIAFILGIFVGYFLKIETKNSIEKVLKIILPVSIALYGFNIYVPTLNLEIETVLLTLLISSVIFISVYFVSLNIGNSKKLSILLSCGSGICGVSAIAIVSSIVRPSKEEFSSALIAITVIGLICTILYPPTAKFLFPDKFYLLSGSTLPQTGLVKIASSVFGDEELAKALSVKAVRISMIAIVAFLLSFLYSEKGFYIPWFIVAFLTTAFLGSYFGNLGMVKTFSTILFASSLAGIGTTIELREIYRGGMKPLVAVSIGMLLSFTFFFIIWRGGLI
ncbi:MAG: putative sulfate exporter family transporter [Archaeoglobaceae archaeon]